MNEVNPRHSPVVGEALKLMPAPMPARELRAKRVAANAQSLADVTTAVVAYMVRHLDLHGGPTRFNLRDMVAETKQNPDYAESPRLANLVVTTVIANMTEVGAGYCVTTANGIRGLSLIAST